MSVFLEQPFWQMEWHGIKFSTLPVSTSFHRLASREFYGAFYDAFFDKFTAFCELDAEWRGIKEATATGLAEIIPPHSQVLSYGCGVGYVEYVLSRLRTDVQLSGFDFSDRWAALLKKEKQSIAQLRNLGEHKYDVICLVQVLYALPFSEGVSLLTSLQSNLREGGRLILLNTSVTPSENGVPSDDNPARLQLAKVKNSLRPAYLQVRSFLGGNKMQFWGWHRNNASYTKMCHDAGFKIESISFSAQQACIVVRPV